MFANFFFMIRAWNLKKNCSISPKQLTKAYLLLCVLSVSVAIYFLSLGIWFILFFTIVELTAVALAFIYFGRHATDYESVTLSDSALVIKYSNGSNEYQIVMNPFFASVEFPEKMHSLIRIEACGRKVEIGKFLTFKKRQEFAVELHKILLSYQT